MKKKKTILIVLIAVIILTILIIIFSKGINKGNTKEISKEPISQNLENDTKKFKNEYENLNGETTLTGEKYSYVNIDTDISIKYVNSLEELVSISENGTGYIYVGSPECQYCRSTIEILLQVLNDFAVKDLYYYDATNQNIDSDNYNESMGILKEKNIAVTSSNSEILVLPKPLLVKIVDGEIRFSKVGIIYQIDEGQESLTDEQKQKVYDQYYNVLIEDYATNEGKTENVETTSTD